MKKEIKKAKPAAIPMDSTSLNKLKWLLALIPAAFAFLLYFQTITFSYTLDDPTVTKDNRIVKSGFAGIATILKTDYWFGYKNESVRGAVYRPMPLILAAIEWQIMPDNPAFYHLINILLYAILSMLLFLLLYNLLSLYKAQNEPLNLLFAFITTMLFVAHPIHTEVVASIKSQDELLCFLFGLSTMLFTLKFIESNSIYQLIPLGISFFFTLLSKESGITFILLIPLMLFLFTKSDTRKILTATSILVILLVIYLLIRSQVLKSIPDNPNQNALNNSLYAIPDFVSREATAFYILLRYLFLLIIPHPLCYDYSFNQIPAITLSNPLAIISLLIYIALLAFAIINIRKKNILSFAIFFFLITLAPVSNVFMVIGSTMAERLLFMPSLGFCLALCFMMIHLLKVETIKVKIHDIKQFMSAYSTVLIIVLFITGIYSIKTFSRSNDWKNDLTLFSHDLEIAPNSARIHFNYGSVIYSDLYPKATTKEQQKNTLDQAIVEFKKAISIFDKAPVYYTQLGQCYELELDYPNAILNYETAKQLYNTPYWPIYKELGYLYTKNGELEKSIHNSDTALLFTSLYHDTIQASIYNYLGFAYGSKGNLPLADEDFKKAIKLNPNYGEAFRNLGTLYYMKSDFNKALEYFNEACRIDSNDIESINRIGLSYQALGNVEKAKLYLDKVEQFKKQSN